MANTENQNYTQPAEGQGDWDTDGNANFQISDRGYHGKFTAGEGVNSGQAITVFSSHAYVYDASSLDMPKPMGLSYQSVNSGDEVTFLLRGQVSSMGDVWSGFIAPGLPVFVDPASPGYLVSSYSAARHAVGLALRVDQVYISPGEFSPIPESLTAVNSIAMEVGSSHDFTFQVGNKGIIRKLRTVADSMDAYKIQFWSGSTKVNSELLYETLTTSIDGGASDFDVQSLTFEDASLFWYEGTDVSSPGLIHCRISPQSAANVGSSDIGVSIWAERAN